MVVLACFALLTRDVITVGSAPRIKESMGKQRSLIKLQIKTMAELQTISHRLVAIL